MSTTVTMPANIEEVAVTLTDIQGLLTAKEWQKAAIVATFVEVGKGQGSRTDLVSSDQVSDREFAALGINGLKSKNTVQRYVKAWQDSGLPTPKPGEDVTLPTEPFNETAAVISVAAGGYNGGTNRPATPKAAAASIAAVPDKDLADVMAELPAVTRASLVTAAADKDYVSTSRALDASKPAKKMRRKIKETGAKKGSEETSKGPLTSGALMTLVMGTVPTIEDLVAQVLERGMDREGAEHALAYADRIIGQMNILKAAIEGGLEPMSPDDFDLELRTVLDGGER